MSSPPPPRSILRFPWPVAAVLTAALSLALFFLAVTDLSRQIRRTIRIYDAQKRVVDDCVSRFDLELKAEGYDVSNTSSGRSGSGDWRTYVDISAVGKDGRPSRCYVEVQGFVSHDTRDRPTWLHIRPMTLSSRGNALDQRFIEKLSAELRAAGWWFDVNNRIHGR